MNIFKRRRKSSAICGQISTMFHPPRPEYSCVEPHGHVTPHRDEHNNRWGDGSRWKHAE